MGLNDTHILFRHVSALPDKHASTKVHVAYESNVFVTFRRVAWVQK
jgi:hypothetical protein